jgi:hypothetical protein
MAASVQETLKRSMVSAEGLYHRLVLLVGETGSGKTRVLQDVAKAAGTSVININLALSSELLELTAKQRALRVPDILDRIVEQGDAPVLLDNLELLFDTELKQDPLRLLQRLSRHRVVVASWNGTTDTRRLVYAENGHPEYRRYDAADAIIVSMDGPATVDFSPNNDGAGYA